MSSPHTRVHPLAKGLQYLALLGYLVFLGFPLVWLLSTAFKTPRELADIDPTWIPQDPTLAGFGEALGRKSLVYAAINSLQVALASALITVLLALPAAYALARLRSVVSRLATGWVLLSQVFPFILIIIPLFLVLRQLGLVNSLPGLVMVYVVWSLPFALWMLQAYVRAIPKDVEEAAAVDGASRLRTLVHVVLPLLTPGVVTTLLYAFVNSWNEFFFALVLMKSPGKQTLPVALTQFLGAEGVAQLGPLAAAAMLATLPSLVFFLFIQRRLTAGLLSGAVKG